ncbi:MAG: motility protein A [Pseudobutyrivibrio sp.]|nr:motility protein A [Pseudobutyrivibrio sp.]
MDLASLLGLLLGVVMVVFGIISSGGVAAMANFIDVPSVIITIGGSLSSVMASNKMSDFTNGFKGLGLSIKEPAIGSAADTITQVINLANISRKEGILALEEAAGGLDDDFLKKGIGLVVDGTDPELVRSILETDLGCLEDRHKRVIAMWEKWGEMGPAWGMIGTLVGLVNMLQNLEDASTIGPNMAVALLTTLYGSLIANWLTAPTAAKLKVDTELEIMMKSITVEGLLSIQAGENPRVIEEKLKSFLPPSQRSALGGEGGGEG